MLRCELTGCRRLVPGWCRAGLVSGHLGDKALVECVDGTPQVRWVLAGQADHYPGYAEILVALDGVGIAVLAGSCCNLDPGGVSPGFLCAAPDDSQEFGQPVRRDRGVETIADSPGSRGRCLGVTADDDGNARDL